MKIKLISFALCLIFAVTAIAYGISKQNVSGDVDDVVLRVGILQDAASVPFVIGKSKKIFENYSLNIRLIPFKNTHDRDTALQSGQLDAISADLLSLLLLQEDGIDFRSAGHTNGGYGIVFDKGSGILAPSDLQGGKIGLSLNTLTEYLVDRFIAENALNPAEIEKATVPTVSARLDLLANGQLIAATLPEPLASSRKNEFSAVISLLTSRTKTPSVFLISNEFLQEHEGYLDEFKAAYHDAVAYCNDWTVESYYDDFAGFLSFPQGSENYEYKPFFDLIPTDENEFEMIKQWATDKGLIQTDLQYGDLCID